MYKLSVVNVVFLKLLFFFLYKDNLFFSDSVHGSSVICTCNSTESRYIIISFPSNPRTNHCQCISLNDTVNSPHLTPCTRIVCIQKVKKVCKDQEPKQHEPKSSPLNQNRKLLKLQTFKIQREHMVNRVSSYFTKGGHSATQTELKTANNPWHTTRFSLDYNR